MEGTGLSSESTGQSEAAGGQSDAPTGTFVAAIGSQPDQLDPHSTTAYPAFQVLENVYDTLVVPNGQNLEMEPALATEWETSDDNLTWTFTLREDARGRDLP